MKPAEELDGPPFFRRYDPPRFAKSCAVGVVNKQCEAKGHDFRFAASRHSVPRYGRCRRCGQETLT